MSAHDYTHQILIPWLFAIAVTAVVMALAVLAAVRHGRRAKETWPRAEPPQARER
jgi:heme/copper-type cytochrome/quinol oxidase subunit 2